jgi:integrase
VLFYLRSILSPIFLHFSTTTDNKQQERTIMASIKTVFDEDGKEKHQVRVRIKGHAPQFATFTRITDAKKWAQQTEAAIREGRFFKTNEARKHTLGNAIDRYIKNVLPTKEKCIQRQGHQLLWWKKQIGHYYLCDVSPAVIAECRDLLLQGTTPRKKLRSKATVVRYMAALSHMFTIAVKEWLWLESSPISKVTKPKEPRGRVRFLSDAERLRLLEACKASKSPFLYTAVVVSLSCGMRKSELMNLKWSDLNLDKGQIILEHTKNNERKGIPLAGLALQLLQELKAKRSVVTDLIFPGKNPHKPIDLRVAWENAIKDSGIKNFIWHDLRHSCAAYMAMNGASLLTISELLNHKSLTMTKRYSHISESHASEAVADMNEKIFG